ncbi:MAG: 4-alpha-glucanotransferase [Miltoncostaeaceae bacterium]|nr:4-alpha-glucanotransferase [Miltoncostaeaceae bacterium]
MLLHPTSLPGGRLGEEARRFVDWLARAGQSWWQVLPLGPPDTAGSPYKSASAFAGWAGLVAEPEAPVSEDEALAFRCRNAYWIDDWIAFAGDGALADQVRFEREWGALRRYAAGRGVRILGDVPIFVSDDSADVVAHAELFQRGVVAGVPPDDFAADGQLWGNPLYDWRRMRIDGYRWWIERLRRTLELVDAARVDHFRGFEAYWSVPEGAATAREGCWRPGPGASVLRAAEAELGALPLVAEDLGVITPAVVRLREQLGLPGMCVLQFSLGYGPENPHRVHNHPERAVAYTGTHDNDTAVGWWAALDHGHRRALAKALAAAGIAPEAPHWDLIRLAFSSPARIAIVPAQDPLGLGSEARLNVPGTAEGNWSWRLEAGQLTDELAERLRQVTAASGRLSPR